MKCERINNFSDGVTLRADGDSPCIGGVAVRYYDGNRGTEYKLWQGVVERIRPGACERAVREGDDTRALFNHDPSLILGRTSANTLKLTERSDGLHYETQPADTTVYADVVKHIERGDVTGSSFGFRATKVEWEDDEESNLEVRWIEEVELFDVSPVTFPAYTDTEAHVRSLDDVRGKDDALRSIVDEYDAWREHKKAQEAAEVEAEQRELRDILRRHELASEK